MNHFLKNGRPGAQRALSIAAGAVGVVLLSTAPGFSDDGGWVKTGMPLSAGKVIKPVVLPDPAGKTLTYTFVVQQNGAKILTSVNKKPYFNIEKRGDTYVITDPHAASTKPILTLPAPTR